MKTKKLFIILLMGFVLFGFLFLFSYDMDVTSQKQEYREISIVVRGKDTNSFETIRQGVEQASNDLRVDASFITLSKDNDVEEQVAMVEREVNNGAQAIIISAADSNRLRSILETVTDRVPVISIESPIHSSKVKSYITGDNYLMGKDLGGEIVRRGCSEKSVMIIDSSTNCENITKRREGVLDAMRYSGAVVSLMEVLVDSPNTLEDLSYILSSSDIVIALEPTILEKAAVLLSNQENPTTRLFGIGSTGKITTFLEKGIIETIVAQNGFNIGYLSVQAAVDALEKKEVQNAITVEHMLITSYNMYSTKSQRMIFPFVR